MFIENTKIFTPTTVIFTYVHIRIKRFSELIYKKKTVLFILHMIIEMKNVLYLGIIVKIT